MKVKLILLDPARRKIGLSMKGLDDTTGSTSESEAKPEKKAPAKKKKLAEVAEMLENDA